MSMTTIAVVLLLMGAIIYYMYGAKRGHRDRFTPQHIREVYSTSRSVFDRTAGDATYSEYKTALKSADPVLYTDTRRLWKEGKLSPEEVAKVI